MRMRSLAHIGLICLCSLVLTGCFPARAETAVFVRLYYREGRFVTSPAESMKSLLERAYNWEQDALVTILVADLAKNYDLGAMYWNYYRCLKVLENTVPPQDAMLFDKNALYALQGFSLGTFPESHDLPGSNSVLAAAMREAEKFDADDYTLPHQHTLAPVFFRGDRAFWLQEDINYNTLRLYVQLAAMGNSPTDSARYFQATPLVDTQPGGLPESPDSGMGAVAKPAEKSLTGFAASTLKKYGGAQIILFHAATIGQKFPMRPDWRSPHVAAFIKTMDREKLWPEFIEALFHPYNYELLLLLDPDLLDWIQKRAACAGKPLDMRMLATLAYIREKEIAANEAGD